MTDVLFSIVDQNQSIDTIKSIAKDIFQLILERDYWINDFYLHPLGFYYCRLVNTDNNQIRLHIWDKGYVIKQDLFIHDHFYDLCSWILCGKIIDYTYLLSPTEETSEYTLFKSSYLTNNNIRTLVRTDNYQKVELIDDRTIKKNEKYFIPRGTFHSNKIVFDDSDIAVTFVYTFNHRQDSSPNIIGLSKNKSYSENDPLKIEPREIKDLIKRAIEAIG